MLRALRFILQSSFITLHSYCFLFVTHVKNTWQMMIRSAMTSKGNAGLHKHPCLHFENKSVKALHWTNMKYLCNLYVLTLTLHAILALYGEQRRDGISTQLKSKSPIDFIICYVYRKWNNYSFGTCKKHNPTFQCLYSNEMAHV